MQIVEQLCIKNKRLYKEDDIIRNSFSPFFLIIIQNHPLIINFQSRDLSYTADMDNRNGKIKLFNVEYPDYYHLQINNYVLIILHH